jgi:hypothetical protein
MAEPIIDVDLLRTAEQDTNDPISGQPNKIEPPDYVKDTGEVYGDEVPVNWFNYRMNLIWQWLKHIVYDVMKGDYTFTGTKIFTSTSTSPKSITMNNGDLDVGGNTISEGDTTINGLLNATGYNVKFDSKRIIYTNDDFIYTGLIDSFKNPDGDEINSDISYAPSYIGLNNILFYKNSDFKMYKKSVNDVNNAINLTTYSVQNTGFAYCGNNIVVFAKHSDNKLYKKSVNDIDNETNLTTADVATGGAVYIGANNIIYRNGGTGFIRKKSINDINNYTEITTYLTNGAIYIGNNTILITKNDNKLYKKSVNDIDGEANITTYTAFSFIYIGNDKILFIKSDNKLYIKSVHDVDNERIVMSNAVSGLTYIGNGIIIYRASDGHFYKKDIKDFC